MKETPESPKVIFTKSEKIQLRRPWRKALIVKLLGKTLGYQALQSRVKQMWQLEGRFRIVDLGQDYFLFKFEKGSERNDIDIINRSLGILDIRSSISAFHSNLG